MPGTALLRGPRPPAGLLFCAICAGAAKHESMAPILEAVQKHEKRGSGVKVWTLNMPEPPAAAVAWGVYPPLGGVVLPLCWSHLAAVQLTGGGGVVPVAGVLADGGQPGPGGAADLSRRHRPS